MIAGIKKTLWQCKNRLKWELEYIRITKRFETVSLLEQNKSAIVVAPHADDELIGCYQFCHNNPNVKIFYCGLLGSNPSSINKENRKNEFLKYCKQENIDCFISSENVEEDLESYIAENKPDYVLIPPLIDWHFEHRLVNHIIHAISLNSDISFKIVWYQVSVPIAFNFINAYIPMSKNEHFSKWNTFLDVYKSQKNMNIERFKFIEIKGAKYLGGYAAEVYRVFDSSEYIKCYDSLVEIEKDMEKMKHSISRIDYIYRDSLYYYQKFCSTKKNSSGDRVNEK